MSETEARAAQDVGQDEAWAVNIKRLVEDALTISAEVAATGVESIKRNRAIVDKIVSDAQQFDNQRQVTANLALVHAEETANMAAKNAMETANMVSKQALDHSRLAFDRQLNVDEQGYTAEQILGAPYVDAIKSATASEVQASIPLIVAAVVEALNKQKAPAAS